MLGDESDIAFATGSFCLNCLDSRPFGKGLKQCPGCFTVRYCSVTCQKANLARHKTICAFHKSRTTDPKIWRTIGGWYGRHEESFKIAVLSALVLQTRSSPNVDDNVLVVNVSESQGKIAYVGAEIHPMEYLRSAMTSTGHDLDTIVAQEKKQSERVASKVDKELWNNAFVVLQTASAVSLSVIPLWTEDAEEAKESREEPKWESLLRMKIDMVEETVRMFGLA